MSVDRSAVAAVLRLAAPDAPPFQLDAAVDAVLHHLGGGITTADRLPTPAPATALPAPPEPAEGQVRVEVVEASEREWPDSGVVLTLTLTRVDDPDAEPIRCRFDAMAGTRRRIALDALGGLADGEPVMALVGRQAVVEARPYTTREGVERVGVARWIVPRKPRQQTQRPPAVRNRKPIVSDATSDDIPF
jgi:hypothetical protein